jgi:hypothetical protein
VVNGRGEHRDGRAPGTNDADRWREEGDRRERRNRCRRDARLARKLPALCERQHQIIVAQSRAGRFDQLGVRTLRRELAVVEFANPQDQRFRRFVAFRRPPGVARRPQPERLFGKIALEHCREAVEVAAPVELARRLQVAAAPRLEGSEQSGRLVVVILLPADRQRCGEARARDQREREVDQRELSEDGLEPQLDESGLNEEGE